MLFDDYNQHEGMVGKSPQYPPIRRIQFLPSTALTRFERHDNRNHVECGGILVDESIDRRICRPCLCSILGGLPYPKRT